MRFEYSFISPILNQLNDPFSFVQQFILIVNNTYQPFLSGYHNVIKYLLMLYDFQNDIPL